MRRRGGLRRGSGGGDEGCFEGLNEMFRNKCLWDRKLGMEIRIVSLTFDFVLAVQCVTGRKFLEGGGFDETCRKVKVK